MWRWKRESGTSFWRGQELIMYATLRRKRRRFTWALRFRWVAWTKTLKNVIDNVMNLVFEVFMKNWNCFKSQQVSAAQLTMSLSYRYLKWTFGYALCTTQTYCNCIFWIVARHQYYSEYQPEQTFVRSQWKIIKAF